MSSIFSGSEWLHAPVLSSGARVALVAPSGPLRNDSELERAVSTVHSLGWEAEIGRHALERMGYLAGSDERRLHDLNAALVDPRIDAVWCLRGGYGAMRLIESVDYEAIRRHPKAIIGYSDITALHLAIAARARVISYHGPTARTELSAFSRASLERALITSDEPCGLAPDARVLRPGSARGRLVGGNLALVASLIGTPYAAQLEGALLVLEDVGEALYRIDRMLTHLGLAGALDGCRGLIFGAFTERGNASSGGDAPDAELDMLLAALATRLRVPCLAGVPVGHIPNQWTLPLGTIAELIAVEGASALYAATGPATPSI